VLVVDGRWRCSTAARGDDRIHSMPGRRPHAALPVLSLCKRLQRVYRRGCGVVNATSLRLADGAGGFDAGNSSTAS
jgi:hypothetical protein